MPVPSSITDLSPDPSLNSPLGTEAVFPLLDDYLRTFAAFIAQLRAGPVLQTAIPDGLLSADGPGRAKMADLFVTLTKLSQDVQDGIAKTGDFKWRFGTSAGSGWYVVDGSEKSRTTDAGLWAYALISGCLAASEGAKQRGQFGPGNGTTTFTLPNVQDDYIRGASPTRGVGTWANHQYASHAHGAQVVPAHEHGVIADGFSGIGDAGGDNSYPLTSSQEIFTGGTMVRVRTAQGGAHTPVIDPSGGDETRPRGIALLPCIKR